MEFLADFLVEFPVESIIQELVSEAWEEELWDLEENHLSQVPGFWGHLEQVLEDLRVLALGRQVSPILQGQALWCLAEEQGVQQLIKPRPKLGLGLVALAEFQGALEFLGLSVVLVASVA